MKSIERTREEQLLLWLEEKKQRKKDQNSCKSMVNSSRKKSVSENTRSATRRSSINSFTTSHTPRSAKSKINSSEKKSIPTRKKLSSSLSPVNKSLTKITTPDHLQRARNVLKERNYDHSSRKRSLLERSPNITSNLNKPIFITRRKSLKPKKKQDLIGSCIDVSNTRMNLSPISISKAPSPKAQASSTSAHDNIIKTEVFSPAAKKQLQKNENRKEANNNRKITSFVIEEEEPISSLNSPEREGKNNPEIILPKSPYLSLLSVPESHSYNSDDYDNLVQVRSSSHQTNSAALGISSSNFPEISTAIPSPHRSEATGLEVTKTTAEHASFQNTTLSHQLDITVKLDSADKENRVENSIDAHSQFIESNGEESISDTTECYDQAGTFSVSEIIRLNRQTVLESIIEEPNFESENHQLEQKLKDVMVEKQILLDKLVNIRSGYDVRITPFREIFEEVSNTLVVK